MVRGLFSDSGVSYGAGSLMMECVCGVSYGVWSLMVGGWCGGSHQMRLRGGP